MKHLQTRYFIPGLTALTILMSPFSGSTAHADDGVLRPLYTGLRSQAMGGAFSAIADDEEAIYINPAGLAGVKRFSVHLLDLNPSVSTDLVGQLSNTSQFSNPGISTVDQFMGKNLDVNAQGTMSFVMPHLGFSILGDAQTLMDIKNHELPTVDFGVQETYGFQLAWGTSVLQTGGSRGGGISTDLRVGAALKSMWRQGGFNNIDVTQLLNASKSTFAPYLGSGLEHAFGADLGVQYLQGLTPQFSIAEAVAWTDIGNTTFGPNADPVKNNLTTGIAGTYHLTRMAITMSYDRAYWLEDVDGSLKNHLGLEFTIPFLSVWAGINGSSPTYGAAFDIWLLRLEAASIIQNLGATAGQDVMREYMTQISVKLGF